MSDNKKYYWLKLKTDFFNQKEIKKLRSIAGGDTYTIIYLKMQLLSLADECNILYGETEDSIAEQLSYQIDETEENIAITMAFLKKHNLIELSKYNDVSMIETKELVGRETQGASRVRRHREKKNTTKEKSIHKKMPKDNNIRQIQYRAKQKCKEIQHIPYIEDYQNNKRYNGNYYLVFKRDEMKCRLCSSIEKLCIHHIDGYNENKHENNEKNKMVTLCRSCHIGQHKRNETIPNNILESIDYYDSYADSNELCNSSVTIGNTEKEKEKEKELELEKELEKELKTSCRVSHNDAKEISLKNDIAKEVIDYLNMKINKNFKHTTKAYRSHINARLSEGCTVSDFISVIDTKVSEWQNDATMAKFIRPETLFGAKFESYLNQLVIIPKSKIDEIFDD